MSDKYLEVANSSLGKKLFSAVGLPTAENSFFPKEELATSKYLSDISQVSIIYIQ